MTVPGIAAEPAVIAPEGTLGARWSLVPGTLVAPVVDPATLPRQMRACVALGYRIEKDGHTSGHAVLAQWNSTGGESEPAPGFWAALAQASADAAGRWRFQPRPDQHAVATDAVSTFLFGTAPAEAATVRQACAIPDLAACLRERERMRELARRRGVELFYAAPSMSRRPRELLPESAVDIDSNRPVHRW